MIKQNMFARIGLLVLCLCIIGGVIWYNTDRVDIKYDVDVELTEEKRAQYEADLLQAQGVLNEKDTESEAWWNAQLEAGFAASALGKCGEALGYYETFLREFPENRIALLSAADIFKRTDRLRKAEGIYAALVNSSRLEQDLRNYVEVIKMQNENGARNEDLRVLLEAAIGSYSQTPYLIQELAVLHENTGDCEQALGHYKVLLDLVSEDQRAQVELDIARVQETCV